MCVCVCTCIYPPGLMSYAHVISITTVFNGTSCIFPFSHCIHTHTHTHTRAHTQSIRSRLEELDRQTQAIDAHVTNIANVTPAKEDEVITLLLTRLTHIHAHDGRNLSFEVCTLPPSLSLLTVAPNSPHVRTPPSFVL